MSTIKVKGMSCNHCKMSVTKALEAIPGVSDVNVDLASGNVNFTEAAPVSKDVIVNAITKIGFSIE